MAPASCATRYPPASRHDSTPRSANARLTAGLKCAPDTGPKIRISTTRMAPVGKVLQRSASAPLPPDSFCAMIPEPMTAASRKAVPRNSATSRRLRSGFTGLLHECCDAVHQHLVHVLECLLDLVERAADGGRIGNIPMLLCRFARNDRTCFTRRIVADSNYTIDVQVLILSELIPRFRAQRRGIVAKRAQ